MSDVETFESIARRVRAEGRTAMRNDRLSTLWRAFTHAPGNAFAEVGVFRGGSAKFIAETLNYDGRSEPFYVCDTFAGHTRVDPAFDGPHDVGGKFTNTSAEKVADYLRAYPNVRLLVGDFEQTCAHIPDDVRFGAVHLDVDVYGATDFCLRFFAPRLALGAMIVVDDYGSPTCQGTRKAVDDFAAQYRRRVFPMTSKQALVL